MEKNLNKAGSQQREEEQKKHTTWTEQKKNTTYLCETIERSKLVYNNLKKKELVGTEERVLLVEDWSSLDKLLVLISNIQ